MAQIYLSEDFNYGSTASNLCGSTGVTTNWVPFMNAGINPVQYSTTNLSYSGYSTGAIVGSGSMQLTLTTGTRESVYTPVTSVNSGSIYFSFLMKSTATGTVSTQNDFFIYLNDTFGVDTIQRARLYIQTPMLLPGYKIGLSKGAGATPVYTTSTFSSSNTVLVIVKYVFNTTSFYDDSVYAWIYTSGVPLTEPAPMLTATDIGSFDLPRLRSICVKQSVSTGSISAPISIDAMRVAATWTNVISLPVTWLNQSAILQRDNSVLLNWSTASEINDDHFEIEKSMDNSSWITVGKVKGNGTTNSVHSYQFADDISNFQLPISNLYYRLKQFDINGKYEYSKVMNVELNKTENYDISIYPNPARNELNIGTKNKALMNLELFDNTGKLIYQNSFIQNLSFNISNYPSGIYFFKINDSETGNIKTKKIVVGK